MPVTFRLGTFEASGVAPDDLMKANGWVWMPARRAWGTAHIARASQFHDKCEGEALARVSKYLGERRYKISASVAVAAEIEIPVGKAARELGFDFRPYQKAGVKYALERHSTLNADVPRLGKTVQWIGVGNCTPNLKRALVICQANAKIQWARDVARWTIHDHLDIGICEGSENPQTPFLILNYDILRRHKEYLYSVEWDLIGIDESHNLANPEAQRTQIILGKGRTPAATPLKSDRRIFMSGSPIFTRPINLWPVTRACDPQGLGRNYWHFAQRYTGATKENGWDTSGACNETELQFKLRSKFMVRREKSDIGNEIPPNRQTVVLPKAGLERLVVAERTAVQGKVAELERLLLGDATPLEEFGTPDEDDIDLLPLSTARKELALAKLKMCVEWIQENLQDERKIVIFAHHRDVVSTLAHHFPGAAVVWGGMGSVKRQAEVDRFQDDPDCGVFIGNIKAAGTAIPLWRANVAVFVELSWSPAEMDQAEERIWIPDKTDVCSIIRMVVADSLDERMSYILDGRQRSIERTMSARYATKPEPVRTSL